MSASKISRRRRELLFVYLGTKIVDFALDVQNEFVVSIFTWDTKVDASTSLRNAVPNKHGEIENDLRAIEANFNTAITPGTFKSGGKENLYVYSHTVRFPYSKVKLVDMGKFTMINEQRHMLPPCFEQSCHEVYLPYFHSNTQCQHILRSIPGFDLTSTPFTQLQDMPNPNELSGALGEDTWTNRLHTCFCSQNINSEFTADLSI